MTALRSRLLVIDDEPRILGFVSRGLSAEGFTVDVAGNGTAGLLKALTGAYDLVILDLLMPEMHGTQALRTLLGHNPEQSVLILSCLTDAETKVACLDLGAEDYLAKPFSLDELLARVRARLRGQGRRAPPADRRRPGRFTLQVGRLTLDLVRREADIGAGPVPLSDREFLLLWELLEHADAAVSKQRLLSTVWGYHFDPDSNVVDVCVWRLRAKLGRDVIKTIRGKGYAIHAH